MKPFHQDFTATQDEPQRSIPRGPSITDVRKICSFLCSLPSSAFVRVWPTPSLSVVLSQTYSTQIKPAATVNSFLAAVFKS